MPAPRFYKLLFLDFKRDHIRLVAYIEAVARVELNGNVRSKLCAVAEVCAERRADVSQGELFKQTVIAECAVLSAYAGSAHLISNSAVGGVASDNRRLAGDVERLARVLSRL